MEKKLGLWIDHRKAVIVTLTRTDEKITHLESKTGPSPKTVGGSRSASPHGHEGYVAEDSLERNYEGHLQLFYSQVLTTLGDFQSLLILGPGEAKIEFRKHLEKHHNGCTIWSETADRLSDPQILKRVRDHYSEKAMEA